MENTKNLFEVRKTVRFGLKPYTKTREILKWTDNYESLDSFIKHIKENEFEKWFDWNNFCLNHYQEFNKKSQNFFDLISILNKEISKHKSDESKKEVFFDFKKSKWIFKNIPSLKKIQCFDNLKPKLQEIESEYTYLFSYFDKSKQKENKNEKASDFSKNLRKIAYLNRNIFTILDFLDTYKTDPELVKKYQSLLCKEFEKQNNSIIANHQNESSWACIWKFTFNKYALLRRETEKLKEKFKSNKTQSEKTVKYLIENKEITDDRWSYVDLKMESIHKLYLEEYDDSLQNRLENLDFGRNLDDIISELDFINGQLLNNCIQKFQEKYEAGMIEMIFSWNQEKKYNEQSTLKSLCWEEKNIKIKPLRWQTLEWYEYLHLLNKEKLAWGEIEQKKLVNKFLRIIFRHRCINKDFHTIKTFRDHLAKYRWKIRQDLRASEREFINEASIKHYAKILEKEGNYFLALTWKEQIKDKKIKNICIDYHVEPNISWDTFKVYNYSQLHFWALEKLCLWDWDLVENKKLKKQWNKYKNQKKWIYVECDFCNSTKIKNRKCKDCYNETQKAQKVFFTSFKNHIVLALRKLKENNGENWTMYVPEIEKLKSIEQIVSFINQKFYKLEKAEILTDKLFELAKKQEIELYQIYSKDFNIFNNTFLSWEEETRRVCKSWEWYKKDVLEVSEKSKLIWESTRKKDMQENLFTLYFKEVFKNTDTSLGQEWGIFFRKADLGKQEKRFRENKFFVSFDLRFHKWKQQPLSKLCEKKDNILEKHIKKVTINYFDSIKKKEEIIVMWIDRWSISSELSSSNKKISMVWYSIIKLRKSWDWNYKLEEILKVWDIAGFKRNRQHKWDWIRKSSESDLNYKKIFSQLKEKISMELGKTWKRDIIKIVEKKKWFTWILLNKILELYVEYKVDYISLENLDNIFQDELSFKESMLESTLSLTLYQNFETQLFNKLQYLVFKNKIEKYQLFPNCNIDTIKKIDSNKWFKWDDDKIFSNYKIAWNIIFVATKNTSSTCFNCDWLIKKHGINCKNCNIVSYSSGQKIDLSNYIEDFVPKIILQKQNVSEFNNDARAWLFIAKRWLEYINSLNTLKKYPPQWTFTWTFITKP